MDLIYLLLSLRIFQSMRIVRKFSRMFVSGNFEEEEKEGKNSSLINSYLE